MSHPEPQDRPDRTAREPERGRDDVPPAGYPYGPEAAGDPPRSPWPGPAAGSPPPGAGWGPPQEPWRQEPHDAAPVRYGAQWPQDEERYGGGAPGGGAGGGGGLPTSTVVLLVVSGLGVFTGFATLAGVPALIIAVVAATSAATDRDRAERLTRTGWIVFVAIIAASILLLVLALVLGLALFGGIGAVLQGSLAGF